MEEIETTPSDTTVTPEVTPVEQAPEAPSSAETPLYELPDGKKVNAETLAKEWKENFLPEYTRKSQALAAMQPKIPQKPEAPTAPQPAPWDANPDWQPNDYSQLAKDLKANVKHEVWQEILEAASAEERQKQERDTYINQEIETLKGLDPKVDANRVMAHAAKYGFQSLIPAYQNMKAIEDAEKRTEERILKNIQARSTAPVGAPTGGGATASFPPDVKSGLDRARYILRNKT